MTVQRAQTEIREGLRRREKRFLEVMRSRIYECPQSPYRKLLRGAGCDLSDLHACVQRHGVEGTLEKLALEGVYLTAEEFKGKREVVRGALSFRVSAGDFQPERSMPGFVTHSSGSNNQPTPTLNPIEWITVQNSSVAVFLDSHDLLTRRHAVYEGILPGAGGILFLLNLAKLGVKAERWFARPMPFNSWLEARYFCLLTQLTVLAGKAFGPGFPAPERVDLETLDPIVNWVEGERDRGRDCVIRAVASNAVRLARRSLQMGISLARTTFVVSGEPLTRAKAEMIRQAGAECVPVYGYSGPFYVGFGCAMPACVDEMHLDRNMFAVINHPKPIEEDSFIHPLLLTTLHASTPILQLNVANGDYAEIGKRACDCALEKSGFSLHLWNLRSYEKFTSEGMNYFYGDLFELLEKQLPAEFGGGAGDYQLIEEEDDSGHTRLTLLVHPEVGALNPTKVLSHLQQHLARQSSNSRFISRIWQDADTFRIRREAPHASARGKILPLRISR